MSVLRRWIWPLWLPVAMALAIPEFQSQISRPGSHPAALIGALIAIVAAIPVWLAARRRWPRMEAILLLAAVIAPPMWRHPVAAAITVAVLVAALGFGRRAMDWMDLKSENRAAEIVIAAGIGLAAWIVVLIVLGLTHLLTAPLVATILIATMVICRTGVAQIARTLANVFRDWSAPGAWAGVHTLFLGVTIAILQPVVLAPSTLYDALATHLASSRIFSVQHEIPPPGGYDFLPQGFELMMAGADTLGGQAAEQMVSPLLLALFWLAIYAIARETGAARETSLGAATLAVAIPFIQWTGANVKNDIGAGFFILAALLTYCSRGAARLAANRLQPASSESTPSRSGDRLAGTTAGPTVACAFLCAAAENVKHTALLGIAPIALLFLIAAWRASQRARTIALACGVFLLFGGFWMARAAWMQGDPFFPLRSPGAMEPMAAAAFHSVADRFVFLVRLQFSGMPVFEGASSTRLGPLFLLFLPAILWIGRRDFGRRDLPVWFFSAVYLVIWISTWPVLRYAAAPIALAASGLASAVTRAAGSAPKWVAGALLASVAFCYLLDAANLSGMCLNTERIRYLARLTDDDAYLRASLPSYPAIAWTRNHPLAGRPILAVGTHAIAYAGDPRLMVSPFPEEGPFSPPEIRKALAQAPYGYAILPHSLDATAVFGSQQPEFADANFAVYRLP